MRIDSTEKTEIRKVLTKVKNDDRIVVYNGFANGVVCKLLANLNPFKNSDFELGVESIRKVLKLLVNEVNEVTIVDKSLLEHALLKNLEVKIKPLIATPSEVERVVYGATNVEGCITAQNEYFSKAELELFNNNFDLYKSAMVIGLESKNFLDTILDEYFN